MKYDLRTTLIIITLFFFSQIIGLAIVDKNFETYGVETFQVSGEEPAQILVSLPVSIVTLTIIFIIFYKLGWKNIILLWYFLAFIITVFFSLSAFMADIYAIIVAVCLLIIKYNSDDDYTHNLGELLVYGGLAVVFLPMLNVGATLLLLIIVSLYDVFSVFYSKHMIILAKTQESLKIFSGLRVRVGNSIALLGGGDIAFPLMFASVILRDLGTINSILAVYGATPGLLALIFLSRKNKFYPAMPLISLGCFLGYGVGLFFLP